MDTLVSPVIRIHPADDVVIARVQLLGGNGYMEDYGQERAMRDAKQAQFFFGRTDVARQALAGAVP